MRVTADAPTGAAAPAGEPAALAPLAVRRASGLSAGKLWAFVKRGFLHAASYRLNFLGTYLGGLLSVVFFSVLARFYGNSAPAALAPYGGDYFTFLLIGAADRGVGRRVGGGPHAAARSASDCLSTVTSPSSRGP